MKLISSPIVPDDGNVAVKAADDVSQKYPSLAEAVNADVLTACQSVPATMSPLEPKEIEVPLIVIDEFDNDELPMLDNVLLLPLIVLLVSVSVVALPTKVSVAVGNVTVPVFEIVEITGAVNVLLVNVSDPVKEFVG